MALPTRSPPPKPASTVVMAAPTRPVGLGMRLLGAGTAIVREVRDGNVSQGTIDENLFSELDSAAARAGLTRSGYLAELV